MRGADTDFRRLIANAFYNVRGSADVVALTRRWVCTQTTMRQEDFINDHIDDYLGLREFLIAHIVAKKLENA